MIVAILSDVHANLPALEKFVKLTRNVADAYVCLGDIVNYGPWNDECLELVHSLPNVSVLEGNHELLFRQPHSICEEPPLVQEFSERSMQYFARLDLVTSLAETCRVGKFLCSHTIGNSRIYPDSDIFISQDHMIGHSHHQFIRQISDWTILNCGSIGQNRKNIELMNYALYDTVFGKISLFQEAYPFSTLINEMIARGYSKRCIDYYLSKKESP